MVGKVQELFKDKVVNRRKELALFTIKGLNLYSEKNHDKKDFVYDLKINHF